LKDIPKLKSILLYHVVSGVVKPNRNGRSFETINGKEISVSEKGDVSDGEDDDDDGEHGDDDGDDDDDGEDGDIDDDFNDADDDDDDGDIDDVTAIG
jgi:hypothetical protein